MPITLNGDTGITTPTYGGSVAAEYIAPVTAFKNRIINGAMQIDQRNAGASVTGNNGAFAADRFKVGATQTSKFTLQQVTDAPVGFKNSLRITSSSSYSVTSTDEFEMIQFIEGNNVSDLNWGTANASAVTLSFQAKSSLTGTFGGVLYNNATNRSYIFSYTINSANTWESKSVTIAGDTSGTWETGTSSGIAVLFCIGAGSTLLSTAGSWGSTFYRGPTGQVSVVGTDGATFYITGVQLEKGSTATSFDYRPYGAELALCQRYYYKRNSISATADYIAQLQAYSTSGAFGTILYLPVEMRATPTASLSSPTHISAANTAASTYNAFTGGGLMNRSSPYSLGTSDLSGSSGLAAGACTNIRFNTTSGYIEASAEL
jgi:hypothetical protein